MEIKGIPSSRLVDLSRKQDHYFDTDYCPYLIEEPGVGILRIPESRPLSEAVPCEDAQFLDFIDRCLALDPAERFTAKEALLHPFIKQSASSALARLREQDSSSCLSQRSENYSQSQGSQKRQVSHETVFGVKSLSRSPAKKKAF